MILEIDTPTFPLIIYVYYSWKEFKSQDLPEPIGRIAQTSWPRRTRFKQIFFSYHEKIPHRGNARLHCCQQLRCPRYSITDVSLPPYRILHQCHQCSSVNRRCNNRPIRGSGAYSPLGLGKFLDFNSPQSPFLGFRVIQTGYWPDFSLESFIFIKIYLFIKNLADFRKTVETGVDPHLKSQGP